MKHFIAIHQYEYETELYHLKSDKQLESYLDNENDADNDHIMQIIDACGIKFEPEKGDILQIIEIDKIPYKI